MKVGSPSLFYRALVQQLRALLGRLYDEPGALAFAAEWPADDESSRALCAEGRAGEGG